MSRAYEEAMERETDRRIAEYLGLSYEEYISLEPEIEEHASDDGLVYSYLVNFNAEVPKRIKEKIKSWRGESAELPPDIFETPDEDYPDPDE